MMARYHFHAVDNNNSLNLRVVELAGYEAALAEAERLVLSLLQTDPERYRTNPDLWEIRVTDEDGREVLSLPFSEVTGKSADSEPANS